MDESNIKDVYRYVYNKINDLFFFWIKLIKMDFKISDVVIVILKVVKYIKGNMLFLRNVLIGLL